MKNLGTFFFILFLVVSAAADDANEVISLARSKNLSESRQWKKLLHIERNALGFEHSQISDPDFFLLKNDELNATLKAFELPLSEFEKTVELHGKKLIDHSRHAICRFPARLKYLKQNLPEATKFWSRLPTPHCSYQEIYLQTVDPSSVSFVFSSYYSDSPGSAFGHTFFRINRKSNITNRQELLDYGVGFAANVTTSNQILYALMGLLGGFDGTWTNLPYYYKVREYNDFESRDLWSYDLNLTPDEVEMLTLHLWEMGPHNYNYYFFTQNCAYHMLTLLEAAAPRLHLTDHIPFYYVIPADSMKALFYEENLVQQVGYRPSLRRNFLARVARLDDSGKAALKTYIEKKELPADLKNTPSAFFLDAAIDYSDLIQATDDEKQSLLRHRAENSFITPSLISKMDPTQDPALSHDSSRWGLSYAEHGGLRRGFFDYRFALHDLLDPVPGLPDNSQLEFFHFNFEALPGELQLRDWQLFKVFNLNPINFFEKKLSWGLELGAQTKLGLLTPGIQAKAGYSWNLNGDNNASILWTLGTLNLRYDHRFPENGGYAAPGLELGILLRLSESMNASAIIQREYPVDREYVDISSIEFRRSFGRSFSLGAAVRNNENALMIYKYF